jgi:N,N'-diacetylchitobiose phosphorylase
VIAECILGRGDRAMKFYDAILPYHQNDRIEVRQAEPYSYCQFIVGEDHVAHGRARHPWLTGSAAWFYTAATRFILGVRPTLEGLVVDPCIPAGWEGFSMKRKWRGATYHIEVVNPDGVMQGVISLRVDGRPVEGPVPIQPPGAECRVLATMG